MAVLKSRESLAVKYRPRRLEQFIGQDQIISLLQGQFRSTTGINRSFLLSGATGCGKCVTEDTMILTPEGFIQIKDIIEKGSKEGFIEKNILVCNKDGDYEKTSHVFYEKTQETYQITTQTNFQIEGTPEHKLLCLEGLEVVWKRLDEIKDTDYVAIQRGMNLWPDRCPDLSFFDCPEFNYSLFSCSDCIKDCKNEIICDNFDPITTITCRICGQEYGNLSTHTKLHGLTPQEYKNRYDSALTSPAQLHKQAKRIDDCFLPNEMSDDLAILLGYLVAEATIEDRHFTFFNKDISIITDFKSRYLRLFGNDLEETYDEKGVCSLQFGSFKRMEFFRWLGILPGHSRTRCIPSIILKSPKHIVASFLRAYFEGDGGWNGPVRISAYSSSERLLRQIQTLLLNFGIVSTLVSKFHVKYDAYYWTLSICSNDVDIFMREIGFISDYKNNQYISTIDRSTNLDVIPNVGNYLESIRCKYRTGKNGIYTINGEKVKISINRQGAFHPNWSYTHVANYLKGREGQTLLQYFPEDYQKLKTLYDLGYFWSKVDTIKKIVEEKLVYDVTLPETHSFFANGFVNHNTSLARVLAHYINCENFNVEKCQPCNTCDYCKDVARGYFGGVDEINFSNDRGIDCVRSVIDSTAYASQYNAHVFICDEIQCLTGVAQNAFLKILEEPPEGVVFLLLTTDPHKLLPTIINRCCPLTLERVDTNTIANHLLKICVAEKRDYFTPKNLPADPEEAKAETIKAYAVFKNIATYSNGYVRQALATLEAVLSMIEGGEKIDTSDPATIKRIVGRFNLDTPDVETTIAQFLISGIYSARYSIALSYALKLVQQHTGTVKQLFDKILDYNMQTLYVMVDPNKKIANLTDAYYSQWYASLVDAAKTPGNLQVVHQSAAELVNIMLEFITQLGTYLHDERRLTVAYTLKMLDAIVKHRHLAYTKSSLFHKVHCPSELLKSAE